MEHPQNESAFTRSTVRCALVLAPIVVGASTFGGMSVANAQQDLPSRPFVAASATAEPTASPTATPTKSPSPAPSTPVFKAEKIQVTLGEEVTLKIAGYAPEQMVKLEILNSEGKPVDLNAEDEESTSLEAVAGESGEVEFIFTLSDVAPGEYKAKAVAEGYADAEADLEIKAAAETAPTEPVEPAPAPTDPAPEPEPAPTEPVEPAPAPTDPAPEPEPAPTEPVEPEPAPTEPVEPEPAPTEPVEPAPTEPVEPEPAPTEPVEPEPAPTEPVEPAPAPTDPAPSQPTPINPGPVEPPNQNEQPSPSPSPIQRTPHTVEVAPVEDGTTSESITSNAQLEDLQAALPSEHEARTDSKELALGLDSFVSPQRPSTDTVGPREFSESLQAAQLPSREQAARVEEKSKSREFSQAPTAVPTPSTVVAQESKSTQNNPQEPESSGIWGWALGGLAALLLLAGTYFALFRNKN
ncbi:hypothetical protein [Rothia sp. P4278]|uniref:hypothetical protein n=1 Tax=Rothia sp. P4278 TaxID=3402658 RepID=UPI003AE8FDC5